MYSHQNLLCELTLQIGGKLLDRNKWKMNEIRIVFKNGRQVNKQLCQQKNEQRAD